MPNSSMPLGGYHRLEQSFLVNVAFASEDKGLYNHNPMFTFDMTLGLFLLNWKNGKLNEDASGQRVLLSASRDGETWSPARPVFPNFTIGDSHVAFEPAPMVQVNGHVYAAASPANVTAKGHVAQGSQCALWPDSFDPRNCGPAADYAELYTNTLLLRRIFKPTYSSSLDVSFGEPFWASSVAPPLFAAQTTFFGINTLTGMDPVTQADLSGLGATTVDVPCDPAATGTTKCEWCRGGCSLFESIPHEDGITNERATYTTTTSTYGSGSTDVILYRSSADGNALWASTRSNSTAQADWSAAQPTNIPDVHSNLDAGFLGDGRIYLAHNPVYGGSGGDDDAAPTPRDPVTLATSSDGGWHFDAAGVALTCLDMPGHGKNDTCGCSFDTHECEDSGVSYPKVVVVVAPAATRLQGTYVAASNNKEDIWVAKILPP